MTDWIADAACAEVGEWLFFPVDKAGQGNITRLKLARQVCEGCPVWRECRIASLGESYGTWAGTNRIERERFRADTGLTRTGGREGVTGQLDSMERLVSRARRALKRTETPDEALAVLCPDIATQPYFHHFEARAYVAPSPRRAAG